MEPKTITCSEHRTPEQEARFDYRTSYEKRNCLKVGNIVYAISEYIKMYDGEIPNFDGGKIIGFKDPWDWKPKTESSVAYVEMPCGCVKFIGTGWLTKYPRS